jgi:hypothetical protein
MYIKIFIITFMDTPPYQQLQLAIEFVREALASAKRPLDYSVDSVKHLDYILGDAFIEGKLKDPKGAFAQQQGKIMFGMAGYLEEVIKYHSKNAVIDFTPSDEHWYINFTLTAENGWKIFPGQRVSKRAFEGAEAELFAYAVSFIKYFNAAKEDLPAEGSYTQVVYVRDEPPKSTKKPWWKVW